MNSQGTARIRHVQQRNRVEQMSNGVALNGLATEKQWMGAFGKGIEREGAAVETHRNDKWRHD